MGVIMNGPDKDHSRFAGTGGRKQTTALLVALLLLGSSDLAGAAATYVSFDPGGSTGTVPSQINTGGAVEGYYTDNHAIPHGFVRTSDGTLASFDPSGSVATYPFGINNNGVIDGTWY